MAGTQKDRPATALPLGEPLNRMLLGVCFIYMIALYWFVMGDMVLWRDEALPLLIVRNNASLTDLFNALRYEGTPGLWHLLLWLTSKITHLSPVHAKAIHFVFFGASVLIVLFLYRIPTVFKLFFIFSYPLITQYAFHVRQYQIAVALILLFFYFYAKEGRHKDAYMQVVLFFLAQTCVHGLILAILLFFFLAAHRYARDKSFWHPAYIIMVAGVILAGIQLLPPPDLMPGVAEWDLTFSLGKFAKIAWRLVHETLFPKPMFGIKLAVLLIILFRCGYLSDNLSNRLFWICLSTAAGAFFLLGYGKISGYRHHGLLSVTFLSYFLVLVQQNPQQLRPRRFISLILIPLIGIGFFEVTRNALYRHNLLRSNSQNVANYLDENYPETPILSKSEIFEAPVRLYRQKQVPIYALGRMAYVHYTVWNHVSVDFKLNPESESFYLSNVLNDLFDTPESILAEAPILVLSGYLSIEEMNDLENLGLADLTTLTSSGKKLSLHALKSFTGAKRENYYLYRLKFDTIE